MIRAAQAVAAEMSGAWRDALKKLSLNGGRLSSERILGSVSFASSDLVELRKRYFWFGPLEWRLTPLGLAVKAIIEGEAK